MDEMILPPPSALRVVEWAARRSGRWTAKQVTEGTGLARAEVDAALVWLLAAGLVAMEVPEYSGVGRPRAAQFEARVPEEVRSDG